MFQVFVVLFMIKTEYENSDKKKVLILLDHVQSLMIIKDNLINSKLFDEVVIIHTENASFTEIENQLDQLEYSENVIFHLMGKEYVGFSIYNRLPISAKVILTCETIVSNIDIKYSVNEFYKKEWFHGSEFDFSKIDEIWSWDSRLTLTNYGLPEKQLDIVNVLKNISFRKSFLELLKYIFNINSNSHDTDGLIYFDTYLLTANNMVSEGVERVLLCEICNSLKEFGLKIKRHPGDRNVEKYNNLNTPIFANSYVPWEVLRLLELENDNQNEQYVYLTYGSTALFHERWLFNNYDSHLIFLDRILNQYSDITFSANDFMPKFIEIYGDKNIYLPENFTELKEIVYNIKNPAEAKKIDFKSLLLGEKDRISKWFIKEYKKNWNIIPSQNNITTLMADYGEGFVNVAEIPFSVEKEKEFSFKFVWPSDTNRTVKQLKWYAVRGRIVKIKINVIICESEDVEQIIDPLTPKYKGDRDKSGYIEVLSYDPCFEIPYEGGISSLTIQGEWVFDNSYQSFLILHNKIAENYEQSINEQMKVSTQLLSDIDGRDIVINQLSIDTSNRDDALKQLMEDMNERDNTIKQLIGDIDERDKSINKLLHDINDRDKNYNDLLHELESKNELLLMMENKKSKSSLKWFNK
jgi:hypothetical protein